MTAPAPPGASDDAAPALRLLGRGLSVAGGAPRPLFAGALHYFRLDPRRWRETLAGLAALGFTTVDTVVPWALHERTPGRFDFGGPRDLAAFLDAVAEAGLMALVRIGPTVGGELLYGGLPERLVRTPAALAVGPTGGRVFAVDPPRAYPLPSLGSRKLLDEVRPFWAALAELLGPRLAPRGPVVAVALDHELGGFHRAGPFCADYHPEVLARFAEEHAGLAAPRAFPRPDAAGHVDPAALSAVLRWLAFREREVVRSLAQLSSLLTEVGVPAPEAGGPLRLHGFPLLPPLTWDAAAAETTISVAAGSLAGGRADLPRLLDRAAYLAGSSRFPLALPVALGERAFGLPRTPDDAVGALQAALGFGAHGYGAVMAVARDRWIGGVLDEEGRRIAAFAEPVARLHAGLVEAGWVDLERAAPVGLLVPRAYGRLALGSAHAHPVLPHAEWLGLGTALLRRDALGFDGPVALEQAEVTEALAAGLRRAGLPFVRLDDSVGDQALARCRALVVPTFDLLDEKLAARLSAFVAAGGALLSGPRAPRLDGDLAPRPLSLPGDRFTGADLDEPALLDAHLARLAAASALAAPLRIEAGAEAAGRLEAALHTRAGRPAVLAVASRDAAPRRARLVSAPALAGHALVDLLDGSRLEGPEPEVALPAFGTRLFRVEA